MKEEDKNRNEGHDNFNAVDEMSWLRAQNEMIFAENIRIVSEFVGDVFAGENIKGMRALNEDAIGFAVARDGKKKALVGADGFAGGGRIAKYVVRKAMEGVKALFDGQASNDSDTKEFSIDREDEKTPQADMGTEADWLIVEEREDWRSTPLLKRLAIGKEGVIEDLVHIEGTVPNSVMNVAYGIRDMLVDIQKNLMQTVEEMLEAGIEDGLRKHDSGSTLVLVVDDPEAEALTIVWNGDSRAYGMTTEGVVVQLTEDHAPKSKDPKYKNAVINVFVAREKTEFKPEILILGGEEYKKYKYFVLATDGVWSQNVDPVKIITEANADDNLSEKEMAHKIVMGAFDAGSSDNISALVMRR